MAVTSREKSGSGKAIVYLAEVSLFLLRRSYRGSVRFRTPFQ
jgi:hypothetical protein